MRSGQHDDPSAENDATWDEIQAVESAAREREQTLRRRGLWDRLWPETVLLESLISKLRRRFHSRLE